MIAGVARGFHESGAIDVFEQPEIGIGITALDLMRRGRRAPVKSGRILHYACMLPPSQACACRGFRSLPAYAGDISDSIMSGISNTARFSIEPILKRRVAC